MLEEEVGGRRVENKRNILQVPCDDVMHTKD